MNASDKAGLVANALVAILTLSGIYYGAKRWIKKWIQDVATQLETKDNSTVGEHTQRTTDDLQLVRGDLKRLSSQVSLINEIESRVKVLEERFDTFLKLYSKTP